MESYDDDNGMGKIREKTKKKALFLGGGFGNGLSLYIHEVMSGGWKRCLVK